MTNSEMQICKTSVIGMKYRINNSYRDEVTGERFELAKEKDDEVILVDSDNQKNVVTKEEFQSDFELSMRSEFVDFIEHQKARKEKGTWGNRQSGLRKLDKWMNERGLELPDLSAKELDKWLTWMVNNEVDERTAYEYMTSVRLFYDWHLMDEDEKNPARNVKTKWIEKNKAKHTKITLSPDEISALVESAQTMRGKAMLSLMASTGLRAKECCEAKLENLDLDERALTVDTVKTDFGERTVYFDRKTRRVLKKYIREYREKYAETNDEYLFLSRNINQHTEHPHVSTDRLRQEFIDAVENCEEIQDKVKFEKMNDGRERCTITSHILRRSFSQAWVDSGGDIMSLKNHQGWENLETAKEYLDETVDRDIRDRYGLDL